MGAYLCGRNSDTNGQHVNLARSCGQKLGHNGPNSSPSCAWRSISLLVPYSSRFEPISLQSVLDQHIIFARDTSSTGARSLAFDIDPGTIPEIPRQPLLNVMDERLRSVTSRSIEPQLWRGNGTNQTMVAGEVFDSAPVFSDAFWVSSVPSGSTTGGLRMRSLRLNSSSECASIAADEFPSNCPGQFPFLTDYTGNGISIRVCVPDGKDGKPWGAMRDRQDIEEEMYLDARLASDAGDATLNDDFQNFTILCVGRSTMGYFELGNLHNQEQPSELLAQWLDPDETDDFDDYFAESPLTSDIFAIRSAANGSRSLVRSAVVPAHALSALALNGDEYFGQPVQRPQAANGGHRLPWRSGAAPDSSDSVYVYAGKRGRQTGCLVNTEDGRCRGRVRRCAWSRKGSHDRLEGLQKIPGSGRWMPRYHSRGRPVEMPAKPWGERASFRRPPATTSPRPTPLQAPTKRDPQGQASPIRKATEPSPSVSHPPSQTSSQLQPQAPAPPTPPPAAPPHPPSRSLQRHNSPREARSAPPGPQQLLSSPNRPRASPRGPGTSATPRTAASFARLRLLPDDPSHADPARGITPAPPPGSLFRRGALAGYRPWWEGGRTGGGDVFSGAVTAGAEREESVEVEADDDDGESEAEAEDEDEGQRWETISAGEAENAEEEHLRWETLRERERGFVSWSRRCL
ncbi:uncharacterized protein VDAG_03718 [Verticillium dahliae VdLs.17]|uniref:Uncharacterized protein n=1 Tax=Verticillium dahliae (strain VdLs.17 / ATCC MYA-4575 / FGSC 10137) TaxID=498257 RepID=G2X0D9_VERDV|nr:uncharacterized protein VDAG_03718 [Verticillium dahliae VdLs.17]EGY22280.1 hypothetical protein VDAG_03718 [Verticillium dahliae VdLs.17]